MKPLRGLQEIRVAPKTLSEQDYLAYFFFLKIFLMWTIFKVFIEFITIFSSVQSLSRV